MKNLLMVVLAITGFESSAFADSTAYLKISDQRIENRSYVDMDQPVYKILRDHEWREFQSQGYFSGSKDDLKDGFIHLSPADQVERIIKKYFSTDHPIYIVKFDNIDFLKWLVWEPASNGDLYPHLYNISLSIDEMDSVEVRE